MTNSIRPLPATTDVQPARRARISEEMAAGAACIVICLLFNPFLALFILAVISVYCRIPTPAFFFSVPISFALFFYFREYGVVWSPGSADDVPIYLEYYHWDAYVTFSGIFTRFFEFPQGTEPLWHILWWPLLNIFGGSDKAFIFIHYLVIFVLAFISLFALSKRYFIVFSVVFILTTPLAIESMTFLWRQQLATSMFVAGVGLYMLRGKTIGKWLVYLSPLMHLPFTFFVAIFIAFNLYREYIGLEGPLKLTGLVLFNIIAVRLVLSLVIAGLSAFGLTGAESYFEGSGENFSGVFRLVVIYSVFLILVYAKTKNDDANKLFIVMIFAVFGIMLTFPGATGIYSRFLIFVFPLYGLVLIRAYLGNFPHRWLVPVLLLVYLNGTLRLLGASLENVGAARFLAFGNLFDPFMGTVKLLLRFWVG